jgi:hypothetical protein
MAHKATTDERRLDGRLAGKEQGTTRFADRSQWTRMVALPLLVVALVTAVPQQADAATPNIMVTCYYKTAQFRVDGSLPGNLGQPVAWKIQWRTYIPGATAGNWVTQRDFLYSAWAPVGPAVAFTPPIAHYMSTERPTSIQVRILYFQRNGANWGSAKYFYASTYNQFSVGPTVTRCLT